MGFVAYSPLGRGFLTGQFTRFEDFAPDDYRRLSPRFQGGTSSGISTSYARLRRSQEKKAARPAQLALAWVLAQGKNIVPIPGTKRRKYLEDNVAAIDMKLSADDVQRLEEIFPSGAAAGERYPEHMMKIVNG